MWRRVPWAASLFLAVLLASVSDTQAQSQCTSHVDLAATAGGTAFADFSAWETSCPAGTSSCEGTAYCIKTGGCEGPCNSPANPGSPGCPNDGQAGTAAGSECIAGMYCGWWMTGARCEDEKPGEPSGRLCARGMGLADACA